MNDIKMYMMINKYFIIYDVTFTPEDTYQVDFIIYDVTFTPEDTYQVDYIMYFVIYC